LFDGGAFEWVRGRWILAEARERRGMLVGLTVFVETWVCGVG